MDNLLSARALMGISLAFHIIYATIGIGLPFMLMMAEGLSLSSGDDSYHRIARGWIRPAAVLFAVGAVSGTILSFELGLLWPRFMEFSGPLVGFAFSMEGFAFFTEAIFLALYSYGERRLSRRAIFLCTIPLTVAAATSALFVISANSWMNTPAGFRLVNGVPAQVQPLKAFFNPAWPHQALHGTIAAYVATAFALSGMYAWRFLRGRIDEDGKRALTLSLAVGTICLPLMFLSGDWAAYFVAQHEKPKLAAMEAHFKTSRGAPLVMGGWPDPATGEVHFGLEVPKLLSFLAHRDLNAVVEGLDAFPASDVPDPRLVHPFFDLMVGSFFVMFVAACRFWWRRLRHREVPLDKWSLWSLLFAGPFGMIALEAGWMVTEFGRQPWVVVGFLRTEQGVTVSPGIGPIFLLFLLVYLALTAGLLKLLLGGEPAGGGPGEGPYGAP
ncbi:cytochrome ubiquinol oxidase subunit I [Geomonas sp. RF6]|uniref:cytochrome ubiquinol oxidase subunit I n=1 Tax=Geomonas sp. RF6 TaxID=2897342 RepID=UPI001E4714E8|nr:cytochrome ubiquinol oxidase subunit I [Geomonas sp. RF6]UFS70454.1 cytochrome ubiquinol oxidase subunit I [Geomonas sp. RF6]